MNSSLVKKMNGNHRRRKSTEPADLYKEKVKSLKKNNDLLAKKLQKTSLELASYKSLSIVLGEFKTFIKSVKFKMTELRSVLESSIFKCDEIIPMLNLDTFEWPSSMTFSGGSKAPVVESTKLDEVSEHDSDVNKNNTTSLSRAHDKNAPSEVKPMLPDCNKKSASQILNSHFTPDVRGAAGKEASPKKNSIPLEHKEVSKMLIFSQITAPENCSEELKNNSKLIKSDLCPKSILKTKKTPLIPELSTASGKLNDVALDSGLSNRGCRRQTFVVKTADVTSKSNRKTFVLKPADINVENFSEKSDSTNKQTLLVPEGTNVGVLESNLAAGVPTTVIDSQEYENHLQVRSNKDDDCSNSDVNRFLNDKINDRIMTGIADLNLRPVEKITNNSEGSHSSSKNNNDGDEIKNNANPSPRDKILKAGNCVQEKSNSNVLCASAKQNKNRNIADAMSVVHDSINDTCVSLGTETECLLSEKDDLKVEATPIRGKISSSKRRVFVFEAPEKKCKLVDKPNTSKIPKKIDASKGGMNLLKDATANAEKHSGTENLVAAKEKYMTVSTEVNSDISNQPIQDQVKPPACSQALLNELPCKSSIDVIDVPLTTLGKNKASRITRTVKKSHKIKEISPVISISTDRESSPVKNDVTSAETKNETENLALAGENYIAVGVDSDISNQPIQDQVKPPQCSQALLNELPCKSGIDVIDDPLAMLGKSKASRITRTVKKGHNIKELSPIISISADSESPPVKNDVTSAKRKNEAENLVLAGENYIVVSTEVDSGISSLSTRAKVKPVEYSQAPVNELNCESGIDPLNAAFCADALTTPYKPKPSRITKKLKKNHKIKELSPLISISTDAKSPVENDCTSAEERVVMGNLTSAGEKIVSAKVDSGTSNQPMQDQVQQLEHSPPLSELNCANGIDTECATVSPNTLDTLCKPNLSQITKKTRKSRKTKLLPVKKSKKRQSIHEGVSPSHLKNPTGDKVKPKKRQAGSKKIDSNKVVVHAEIHPVPPSPNLPGANKENEAMSYQPAVVLKDVLKSKHIKLFNIDLVRDSARLPLSPMSCSISEENVKNEAAAEDFPGRRRRARKEINYKELPLSAKMRR